LTEFQVNGQDQPDLNSL